MAAATTINNASTTLLRSVKPLPWTPFNRVFAAIYTFAILALFYHHIRTLFYSPTLVSFLTTLTLLVADIVLFFMWLTAQALRMKPIRREEFPENLEKVMKRSEYPGLDVFICTADPYKEPPMGVVSTALSVMAYDYPTEKLSVYVSDDGGSALTLFAFMEAAKFATHWLPFCKNKNLAQRSPNVFFGSNYPSCPETQKIKMMYESMKARVEHVVERGKVADDYITNDKEREAFNKWTHKFTPKNHPTIIQVLLDNSRDVDTNGDSMPNLIYVSREKSKTTHHNFKAGALNALIRVSAVMTNAPIILTLDCDMYSNDPQTPLRVLCYYGDPNIRSEYALIQFPQLFQGLNESDTYAGEFKRLFQIQPMGFDGLRGPNHVGTNAFFSRRAFFGRPSSLLLPEIPELGPDLVPERPIQSQEVLELACHVSGCNYENRTEWGSKMGFRYGSLVEDLYTGYRLYCEGWRGIFCSPTRPAFLGDAPSVLLDLLIQQKRWAVGVLEMGISKHSPITFGIRNVGPLLGIAYSQYGLWTIWSIPITIYAFLPQLALLNNVQIFPKASEPWFFLYVVLFLGSYGQDLFEFVMAGGTFQSWWNDTRIWKLRGVTCLLLGFYEFILKSLGIAMQGFNVTSKVVDDEQSKRYDQGIFEFGVHSPLFVPLVMAALINFLSLVSGFTQIIKGNMLEELLLQMFLAGYIVVACWPIYEAMVLRTDNGKLPAKTTIVATCLALSLCAGASFLLKQQHIISFIASCCIK